MIEYQDFIAAKVARLRSGEVGIDVPGADVHSALYDFQRVITRRALRMGRCAMFEDCGMGKTIQELEWARHIVAHTGKPVLIFAPLAVGPQMVKEGERIDVQVGQCRNMAGVQSSVNVTNYEMLHHFTPDASGAI